MMIAIYGELQPGLVVGHDCDNPPCINPDHLWLGTQYSNIRDRMNRNRRRYRYGEEHAGAKITEKDVLEIRSERAAGVPASALAVKYGITRSGVYHIEKRRNWRTV